MSFKFLNEGQSGNIQQFTPIDTFIDPVSKIRVSNPSNLIDTDFEYGLQPTKWETVELINNTPAFFSKGGDTTIPDITGITTNAGTREITVTTAFPHNLAVGIPIRVSGTKSVTADGSYIINATPTITSFTYLARANQTETISIFDLYSSIITGEFFQGSQISISDSEGITTDGEGPTSTLTVKTQNKHGFGINTPFYFLNLNSTISQEFESQNSSSLSFDPTNSATAQNFDGSNSLLRTPIDLSNSATTSTIENFISNTDATNATFTLQLNPLDSASWAALKTGSPLYYSVGSGSGYFQSNPRGVVFIKSVENINSANNTATFQVSATPEGPALAVASGTQGSFQIADQARTFAGNNVDAETQIDIEIIKDQAFDFDGGNRGYEGDPEDVPSNTGTITGFSGQNINLFTSDGFLDYYVGAMLVYKTDSSPATGLVQNATYFVKSFGAGVVPGTFLVTVSELPGGPTITASGGGDPTERFEKIGISVDKDIFHIRNSNFTEGDMLEYTSPAGGSFSYETESPKKYFFVSTAFDPHNYRLVDKPNFFKPVTATGGESVYEIWDEGRFWKVHEFTTAQTSDFEVTDAGEEGEVEYLVVGGGGGGGMDMGGGGGAGGVLSGQVIVSSTTTYPVVVGVGGNGAPKAGTGANTQGRSTHIFSVMGTNGGNSSFAGVTALGGGRGGVSYWTASTNQVFARGQTGASGGGASGYDVPSGQGRGEGTPPQGFAGGHGSGSYWSGGGGGAGGVGGQGAFGGAPAGGPGIVNSILGEPYFWGGGGGGAGYSGVGGNGRVGGGGAGAVGQRFGGEGYKKGQDTAGGFTGSQTNTPGGNGGANTGGGGGGGSHYTANNEGGDGGSGIVVIRYPISGINEDIISATGGKTYTTSSNGKIYAVHEFKNVGSFSFSVSNAPAGSQLDYLIIAGGGGGGGYYSGGGGGAGGYRCSITGELSGGNSPAESKIPAVAQSYPVVVGAGGAGGNGFGGVASNGAKGQNSSFAGIVSIGGGAGAAGGTAIAQNIKDGGSGGGASGNVANNTAGQGTSGQGFNGGSANSPGSSYGAAGGGGAGGLGGNGTFSVGGDGGPGLASSITGLPIFRAGGGGAGAHTPLTGRPGGIGGGGAGGNGGYNISGFDGLPNTGGGGGGANYVNSTGARGGSGGSGLVVIRYEIGNVRNFSSRVQATGGEISDSVENGVVYRFHQFKSVGTANFVVTSAPSSNNQVDCLIVAGGGGGGGWGGGGGAGGLIFAENQTVSTQTYPITVGGGGARGTSAYTGGGDGAASSALGLTAPGGGGGGWYNGNSGRPGGSGGGGGLAESGSSFGGNGSNFGNPGGRGGYNVSGWQSGRGGGGGGAGEAGFSGDRIAKNVGYGGNGRDFSKKFGPSIGDNGFFAGGGGGHSGLMTELGLGGRGGGGRGGRRSSETDPLPAFSGMANTGGGGGGAWGGQGREAGLGGSGIVIIRYPIGAIDV